MAPEGEAVALASVQRSELKGFRSKAIAIGGAGLGNVLEWYDFTVYAYLAATLGHKFFSSSNETAAILATFAVFGAGFVARPLGGILIGMFGDRYGRKPTLLLTFALIATSTGLIGVLPTASSIGLWAPILLVAARLLQGVSAGGEWGGSASFLVEWAPAHRRGLFGSLHTASINLGQLLGAAVTGTVAVALGPERMNDWGWRVPFLLGALIGPFGFLIRQRLHETPAFRRTHDGRRPAPLRRGQFSRTIFLAFAFPAVQSVLTYLFLSYFPTFSHRYAGLSQSTALWSTALASVVIATTCIISGFVSDRVGRRPCMLASCALSFFLPWPILAAIVSGAPVWFVILGQALFAAACGMFLGAMPAALVELFPTSRRMVGLTTGYNLQSMLFGGFAPFIAAWLIATTGHPVSIAFFIMLAAAISAAAILSMRETAHEPLA